MFFSSRNWWKRTYWQRSYFWGKRQEALEKKLGCKFIRINTNNAKNGYDYNEVGNVQAFIDEFKNKKIKELEDKIKEKEEESNKKIKELKNKIKEKEEESNKKLKHLGDKIKEEQKSKFTKELLSYVSSISMPAKHIKYFVKKVLPAL